MKGLADLAHTTTAGSPIPCADETGSAWDDFVRTFPPTLQVLADEIVALPPRAAFARALDLLTGRTLPADISEAS